MRVASIVRADDGMTLMELLITLMIMGIAFVAILSGMTTAIIASDLHRKQATGETAVRDLAEAVQRDAWPSPFPTPCPTTWPGAGYTPPSGFVTSTAVEGYLDVNTAQFNGPCSSDAAELVAVTVRSTDGRATESTRIVKRKP